MERGQLFQVIWQRNRSVYQRHKCARGSTVREKRMGPRAHPWGTPHSRGADEDARLLIQTNVY